MAVGCSWFFILLVLIVVLGVLALRARATGLPGQRSFGLFYAVVIILVFGTLVLGIIGRDGGGRDLAVFCFLLVSSLGVLAIMVRLLRGPAPKSAAPFFPAPERTQRSDLRPGTG